VKSPRQAAARPSEAPQAAAPAAAPRQAVAPPAAAAAAAAGTELELPRGQLAQQEQDRSPDQLAQQDQRHQSE
jgi:hypothetical protein